MLFPSLALAADSINLSVGDPVMHQYAGSGTFGTQFGHTFNAATDEGGPIFKAHATHTITKLCLHHLARDTGDPGAHTIALQGVSAASPAIPDGSTKSSGNASCTVNPPATTADDGKYLCCTMTSSYAATIGEDLAMTISCASGCDASNRSTWAFATNNNFGRNPAPYAYRKDDGAAATFSNRGPMYAYVDSDGRAWGNPVAVQDISTFNSSSTPDEKGTVFVIPATQCATRTLIGFSALMKLPIAATSARAHVYTGTTSLGYANIDGDMIYEGNGANEHYPSTFYFNAPISITCGSTYRLTVQAQDATSAVGVFNYSCTSAEVCSATFGGASWYYTERTDAGAFSDTATKKVPVSLIFSDSTVSGGGGSDSQFNKGLN